MCFRSWRQQSGGAFAHIAVPNLRGFDQVAAAHVARMQAICKALKLSAKQDEAAYARKAFADAKDRGPAALAAQVRSILKVGRSFRPPRVAVHLQGPSGQVLTEPAAVQAEFGRHFAVAEHGRPTTLTALDGRGQTMHTGYQSIDGVPTISNLMAAFSALKVRKAAGLSGIPAEAYRACSLEAAQVHMPLVLKAVARGQLPALWRGLLATALLKPGKQPDQVDSYRSIALTEPSYKAFGRALRPHLECVFARVALPTVGGARKAHPTELPAMAIQAHIQHLRAAKQCGAVLFVDGVSAFYSVDREALFRDGFDGYLARLADMSVEPAVVDRLKDALGPRGALLQQGVHDAAQDLLRTAMRGTWFTTDPRQERLYETAKGTIPGSPLADILFQLAAATALHCLNQQLQEEGLQASLKTESAVVGASPASWLDDIAVVFRFDDVDCAIRVVSRAVCLVQQYLLTVGIRLNFAPGKSELMMVWAGPGASRLKQQVMLEGNAKVPLTFPGGQKASLRCVDSYVHLGTTRTSDAQLCDELAARAEKARAAYRPLRARILTNQFLTLAERTQWLVATVFARLLHGAGTWSLPTRKARLTFEKHYMSFVRGAVRPLHGVPCRRLDAQQACAVTDVLLPAEALAIARVRTLAQLADKGDVYTQQCLLLEGTWLAEVRQDVRLIAGRLHDPRLATFAAEGSSCGQWTLSPAVTKALLRRFRRRCVSSRAELKQRALCKARAHERLEEAGCYFFKLPPRTAGPLPQHVCRMCRASCSTASALAAHWAKCHDYRSAASRAFGTSCEACGRQYWATGRLAQHLRRSHACAAVYQEADIDPGPAEKLASKDMPPAVMIGPRPFWATLRPQPQDVHFATPCTPDPSEALLALEAVCQLTPFFETWVRTVESWSIVVQGLQGRLGGCHAVARLAAAIAPLLYQCHPDEFITVGDVSALVGDRAVVFGPTSGVRLVQERDWALL